MKSPPRSLSIAVVAMGLTAQPLVARQGPDVPRDVVETIKHRVDHKYNAGVVVGIVEPAGTRYFGYGSLGASVQGTPDEATVFEIGSITKVFTAILLADMVERGEVRFDDPIDRLLPVGVRAPSRNGRSITLADLATQTSGLPRMPDNFTPADPNNPYADYTVDQLYGFLSQHRLRRDIGTEYEYSNYGMGLLGHLLARSAGVSFEQLVVRRIADVLDMPDTRIGFTPSMNGRTAAGHVGPLEVSNWDIPTLAGAGALRSTARDMLAFIAANMGLVDSPLRPAMVATHQTRSAAGSPSMHIGLGWHIRTVDGGEIVWHNGGTGGYRSFAGFTRDGRRGAVVLTNSSTSADDIGFHLLDPTWPLDDVKVPAPVDAATLARYVGQYRLQEQILFDIGLENGQLTVQLTGQPRFPLYAESDTTFFVTVVDASVTFRKDAAGDVTSLVLHQGGVDQTARRISPDDEPPAERVEIDVDSDILAEYVGEYELAPGVVFDVTLIDDRLHVMLTGQPRFPVFAESEARFFYKIVDAQLTFVRDSAGVVTSLVLHQNGMDQTARRLP